MNCAGSEILRYLNQNTRFTEQNQIVFLSTYKDPPHNYLLKISNADVLIVNDVKNIEHYKFEYIIQHAAPHAMVYRVPFWRFDGLWSGPHLRVSEVFFYDDFELEHDDLSLFDDRRCYEIGLEKFSITESNGFIKMVDFISDPIQCARCFSDNWHPTPYFFYLPVATIMVELGYSPNEHIIPPTGINRNRIRLFGKNLSELVFCKTKVVFWLDRYVEYAVYSAFQHYCKKIVDINLINDVGFLDLIWLDFVFKNRLERDLIEIPNFVYHNAVGDISSQSEIEYEFVTKIPLFCEFYVEVACQNGLQNKGIDVDILSKTKVGCEHLLVSEILNLDGCKIKVLCSGFDITNLVVRFRNVKKEHCDNLKIKILIPFWRIHE